MPSIGASSHSRLGIVAGFDQAWLRDGLRYVVAVSAIALLVIACNAAMFGLSRLGYSLALNRQIPSLVGWLHPALRHAGRPDRARRAARGRARDPGRPRVPRRDLRVRRDARVHDRPPLGDPAALPRARAATGPTRCRSTCAWAAAELPLTAVLGAVHVGGRVRLGARPARRRALRRRRLDGVRRRCSTWSTARSRASRCSSASRVPARALTRQAASRPSSARSSCPCSARRSTTTSCRRPGGWPGRRTRTSARAAR